MRMCNIQHKLFYLDSICTIPNRGFTKVFILSIFVEKCIYIAVANYCISRNPKIHKKIAYYIVLNCRGGGEIKLHFLKFFTPHSTLTWPSILAQCSHHHYQQHFHCHFHPIIHESTLCQAFHNPCQVAHCLPLHPIFT